MEMIWFKVMWIKYLNLFICVISYTMLKIHVHNFPATLPFMWYLLIGSYWVVLLSVNGTTEIPLSVLSLMESMIEMKEMMNILELYIKEGALHFSF